MPKIEVNVDLYGNKLRISYLADLAEFTAFQLTSATVSEIQDIAGDLWGRRADHLIDQEDSYYDDADDSDEDADDNDDDSGDDDETLADRIYEVLSQRKSALGDAYPFRLDGVGIGCKVTRKFTEDVRDPYIAMLATSFAHAHILECRGTVQDDFEAAVVGLFSQSMPTEPIDARAPGKVQDKIRSAAEALSLKSFTSKASFGAKDRDSGSDLVCHMPTNDRRHHPGFVFIGQVTCGRWETWKGKAVEPSINAWRKTLMIDRDPTRFLVVPQHVDRAAWKHTMQECSVAVFDRLRLVSIAAGKEVSECETAVMAMSKASTDLGS